MWTEIISDNEKTLAKKLAISVGKQLTLCLKEKNKVCLAVSGGITPIEFFQQLSQQELEWAKVTVILVDERWLPIEHDNSNEKLVRDHLIQNKAQQAYFLGMKNSAELPSEGIMDCETQLRTQIEHVDIVVFGMGLDGHTASWFKGSNQLSALLASDTAAWCLPVEDEFLSQARMSLTWRFIKRAKKMYLHFTGEEKNTVFKKACVEKSENIPVAHLLHQDGMNISVYHT